MNLLPTSANPNLGRALVIQLGAPLRTVVVGKKQEFPVSPVDPLAFPETGEALCCALRPRGWPPAWLLEMGGHIAGVQPSAVQPSAS